MLLQVQKHISPLPCGVICSTRILKLCEKWIWLTWIIRREHLTVIFDWKMRKCTNSCCRAYPILALTINKPTLSTLENTNYSVKYFHGNWEKSQGYSPHSPKPQPSGLALHPGTVTTIRIPIHSKEIHNLWVHSNYLLADTEWLGQRACCWKEPRADFLGSQLSQKKKC